MKRIYDFMDRYRDPLDFVLWFLVIAFFVVVLISLLTGCTVRGGWPRFLRPGETPGWHVPPAPTPTNDLAIIMPPGFVPSSNTVKPKLMSLVVPSPAPVTNITVTCDIGTGPWSGVNLYGGMEPWQMSLLGSFFGSNQFNLSIPVAYPILLEARTFVSWPAPGVVDCSTNDDTSVTCVTNTYYENPVGTDFIYVPPGCTNQWVFLNNDGTTTLAGWGVSGYTYHISSGQLGSMLPVPAGVLTGVDAPWLHTTTGEGPNWATKVVGP